jgi:hypothetical protein
MSAKVNIRWGWLKGMYIYTIIVAGGFGLGLVFVPSQMQTIFKMPVQDSIVLGILGSVYVAFAILSILGLQSPLKFSPILLLQLGYKAIWLVAVVLPALITGSFPTYAIMFIIVFATFIIGDLIAIPFKYLFCKECAPME